MVISPLRDELQMMIGDRDNLYHHHELLNLK
jgi:hypothetical protein